MFHSEILYNISTNIMGLSITRKIFTRNYSKYIQQHILNPFLQSNISLYQYNPYFCKSYPKLIHCVLITHSLAIRLFIMRWFHYTVEEFECMCSPKNCDLVILEKDIDGHYQLVTPLETSESINMRKRPIRL